MVHFTIISRNKQYYNKPGKTYFYYCLSNAHRLFRNSDTEAKKFQPRTGGAEWAFYILIKLISGCFVRSGLTFGLLGLCGRLDRYHLGREDDAAVGSDDALFGIELDAGCDDGAVGVAGKSVTGDDDVLVLDAGYDLDLGTELVERQGLDALESSGSRPVNSSQGFWRW